MRVAFWSTSMSYDHKRDFSNFQIEYHRIFKLGLTFLFGDNFGPSMTYEILSSEIQSSFPKIRSGPPQHLFSIADVAKWAPRMTKI